MQIQIELLQLAETLVVVYQEPKASNLWAIFKKCFYLGGQPVSKLLSVKNLLELLLTTEGIKGDQSLTSKTSDYQLSLNISIKNVSWLLLTRKHFTRFLLSKMQKNYRWAQLVLEKALLNQLSSKQDLLTKQNKCQRVNLRQERETKIETLFKCKTNFNGRTGLWINTWLLVTLSLIITISTLFRICFSSNINFYRSKSIS